MKYPILFHILLAIRSAGITRLLYAGLALLFQPFFKIALGREIWNIVDLIVGAGLILSVFLRPKETPRQ